MVGAGLACCLGGSDLKVAVIEENEPQAFDPAQPFDLRVSALSIASRRIMEAVGAWQGIENRRYCPFKRMRVWEAAGDTEFNSRDINEPDLGCIVENRLIQLAFIECLKNFFNIDLYCPARCAAIRYDFERSSIVLDHETELSARLLIAADGAQSRVRQSAGIGVDSRDYKQHALVMSVKTTYGQQDITWQRFVPSGPQAFLPLPEGNASLVWYDSPDRIRRLKSLSSGDLLTELQQSFPDSLGEIEAIAAFGSFPLKRQHAHEYVKPGIALIGDAAHTINPLAGQGVNIGFLDAAALAQVIINAREKSQDIGNLKVLKRYQNARRPQNLLMMTTMDLFYWTFSNANPPLKALRNFGLGLANKLTPARNKVMRYAMGLDGNLPKLARGQPIVTQ